jgi:hypothetical protein
MPAALTARCPVTDGYASPNARAAVAIAPDGAISEPERSGGTSTVATAPASARDGDHLRARGRRISASGRGEPLSSEPLGWRESATAALSLHLLYLDLVVPVRTT